MTLCSSRDVKIQELSHAFELVLQTAQTQGTWPLFKGEKSTAQVLCLHLSKEACFYVGADRLKTVRGWQEVSRAVLHCSIAWYCFVPLNILVLFCTIEYSCSLKTLTLFLPLRLHWKFMAKSFPSAWKMSLDILLEFSLFVHAQEKQNCWRWMDLPNLTQVQDFSRVLFDAHGEEFPHLPEDVMEHPPWIPTVHAYSGEAELLA